MPLHFSGMVTRRALVDPEPPAITPPAFDKVLKFNPNHDKAGRFVASVSKGKPAPRKLKKTQRSMDMGHTGSMDTSGRPTQRSTFS